MLKFVTFNYFNFPKEGNDKITDSYFYLNDSTIKSEFALSQEESKNRKNSFFKNRFYIGK